MIADTISDIELLAYIDGEPSSHLGAFLEQEPALQARLHDLENFQTDLRKQLHPITPPSSFELGEYYLKLLPAARASQIKQYLDLFPYAQHEIDQIAQFLKEPDLPPKVKTPSTPSIPERFHLFISKWLSPSLGGLAPVGIRAGTTVGKNSHFEEAVYEFDNETLLSLHLSADETQPSYKILTGFIDTDTPMSEASLWHAHQAHHVASAPIDDAGDFRLPHLEKGTYNLVLTGAETEIHIEEITI